MIEFCIGLIAGYFAFRFKGPIVGLWKRTEGEIENSINKAIK